MDEQQISEEERYRIFVLCECEACEGHGNVALHGIKASRIRCTICRGEGRVRQEVATCGTPEALGVAIVTLGREGEFVDCPIGVLDSMADVDPELPEDGRPKWLVLPWLPSARNVSEAGRVLAKSKAKS